MSLLARMTERALDKMVTENIKLKEQNEEVLSALVGLLNDTQHSSHECGDTKWCPVLRAKEVAEKYASKK